MKYISRLSWGIVIYAIMYLFSHGLSIYGVAGGILGMLARLVMLVIIATIAGRSLHLNSWKDILPYSIFWAFTVLAIDAVYTVPSSGVEMYSNWNLWIGYALVMLLPLAAPQTRVFHDDAGGIA
jgi:hypothetical protein